MFGLGTLRRVAGEVRRDVAAAHDRDPERPPQLASGPEADGERERAQKRRHGGHQNGPEAQEAGLVDGLCGRQVLLALGRKVDHQDRVLLHDSDEQDDPDERDHAQLEME